MDAIRTIPTLCWSVAANPSPLGVKLHDAGYAATGLEFKYVALGADEVAPVVDAVRRLGVRGLGVSMPHKMAVIELLDRVSPDVEAIGACNTVVNDGGVLTGYNTDWRGAMAAIDEAGLGDVASALIVGAGGVARAIAYGLKQRNVAVTVAARNSGQAQVLVDDLQLAGSLPLTDQRGIRAELVVNATPDAGHPGAVDTSWTVEPRGVFDVVFQTRTTALTRACAERGIAVAPGWRMLLLQATAQFKLYTGKEPPLAEMGAVLENALPDE